MKTLAILTCGAVTLAACGGGGGSAGSAGSSLNPFRWFGGGNNQPATLAPEGGYPTQSSDNRAQISRVTGARWEPLYEGRLLVVTGLPATKGWWAAELITEVPMPEGRVRGDAFGVLRLRLVGLPPLENTFPASVAAQPGLDEISVAMTLSNEALATISEVVITGGTNSVTLRR